MKPRLIIAIDPGQSGGIAFVDTKTGVMSIIKMPATEADIFEQFEEHTGEYGTEHVLAVIEAVGSMPGQGVSSTFKFGQHYGLLRGMLAALHVRREFVRPQKWQAAIGIPKRGKKSKTEHKNVLKSHAQETRPALQITLATADAVLIAEYAIRFLI